MKKIKILFCDPVVHTGTSQMYKYYDGIFNELIKREDCEILWQRSPPHVSNDWTSLFSQVDVVVFGLGWFNHKYYEKIKGLEKVPSICILFKPQNDLDKKLSFCKINNISNILTPIPSTLEYHKISGVKTILFPYAYDENVFYKRSEIEKNIDIGFTGALHENKHYPPGAFPVENIRTKIGDLLKKKEKDINVYYKSSDDRQTRIPSYEKYAEKICESKLWLATQAAFGDITPRYFEILASGTLLFCQKIPDEYKHIFISGVNCIDFSSDMSDFEEKLNKYIKNNSDRKKITDKAVKDSKNHTWKVRTEELVNMIKGLI